MRPSAFFCSLAVVLAACGGTADRDPRVDLEGGDWTDLFDGASFEGWHGYATDTVSDRWSIEDGAMVLTPDGGDWDGDLVAPGGPYGDFELEVEWSIAACGNSGIFYRGEEDADLAPIWRTALEAQILDDSCHPDGKYPSHRVGGLYDLYVPEPGAERPAGAWNTTRIVADGARIEHYLNGRRVVQAEQGSRDWNARLAVSKFRNAETFPAYGTRRSGIVGIQDHGDTLRVRSVRIRPL